MFSDDLRVESSVERVRRLLQFFVLAHLNHHSAANRKSGGYVPGIPSLLNLSNNVIVDVGHFTPYFAPYFTKLLSLFSFLLSAKRMSIFFDLLLPFHDFLTLPSAVSGSLQNCQGNVPKIGLCKVLSSAETQESTFQSDHNAL